MKFFDSNEDILYFLGWVCTAAIIIGLILYYLVFIPLFNPSGECSYYAKTGIYCFGCGGTRAVIALLHGHVLRSFYFHPLVLYFVVMYSAFMGSHTLERLHVPKIKGIKFHTWYIYCGLFLFAGNWFLKNLLLIIFHIKMPLA